MKRVYSQLLRGLALGLGLLAGPLGAGPAGSPPDEANPVLRQPLNLVVPADLWHLTHTWEGGILRLRIDADGLVEDWVPLDLPHHRLVSPLDRALAQARFDPARLDGEAVGVELVVDVALRNLGGYGIFSETVAEHIEGLHARINPRLHQLVLCPPRELDKPLRMISQGPGYQVLDENGNRVGGTVLVEFYVDPEGLPRLMRTPDEADPGLAEAAILTVREFRFEAPRRNGQPVVVKARIPVIIPG